jgi:hypothetical protein
MNGHVSSWLSRRHDFSVAFDQCAVTVEQQVRVVDRPVPRPLFDALVYTQVVVLFLVVTFCSLSAVAGAKNEVGKNPGRT